MAAGAPLLGLILASDETVISSTSLLASNIWFWLEHEFVLTNRRLAGKGQNLFLGLVPVGPSDVTYPLNNIAGVRSTYKVNIFSLIFGILFALAGLDSVFLLVIGLVLLVNSVYHDFRVTNSGGDTIHHRVALWKRSKARSFVQEINTAIAERV